MILSVFLLFFLTVFAIGAFGEFRPANLAVILVLALWVPLLAVHELWHAAVAAVGGFQQLCHVGHGW